MSFTQAISPQLSFIELISPCDHDLLSEISSSDDIPEILAMLLLDETLSSTLKFSIKKQLKMLQQK
ncbi:MULTISPECIES: hypothetical protein [Pseudoalteromonas]|uniref:Orphan protein n=1 Tax=Pseudoalteromonas haloplanktis TaxID=228 RepID=A0ABU1BJ34_PSEHA|nr:MULTISPECIES: hypothetical protein [Pseudoalteromonas]MCF6142608.1 hypothetical protein [Pseudoalteromonas mariniglutinosa NCIMB 1770]MDQ9093597.1 hypothetical protein [Pseudoalteromonas haloplanktis]TMN71563.1 hypothetical protein CWB85_10400 [Pseudoalteromonas sp. S1727]BDF94642.1 hypothetical protein KAN5_14800 [Pseudoalteromonas sp. KAN5]